MKEKLTLADNEVINQIRRWPTLYRSAHSFFHSCIIGGQGSYVWKNGLLISEERQVKMVGGKQRCSQYPFRVPREFAQSLLNNNHSGFMSVSLTRYAPICSMPDNAHEDWLEFISFHLFLDSKITPELYEIVVQANCIRHYGMVSNPHSGSEDHYRRGWAEYFKQIPNYESRIKLIRETRELGKTPPDRYMGIDI